MIDSSLTPQKDGHIRPARPPEAEALSELALRSKAHWGYEPAFLAACRAELTLTPEFIEKTEVHVLEVDERLVGFYSLVDRRGDLELGHFFIDPLAIGGGAGKRLWRHAVDRARNLGAKGLVIESDPYAEGFYHKLGARRIGVSPSPVAADRMLPVLWFSLTEDPGEFAS